MNKLRENEQRVYQYIVKYIGRNGYPPTAKEIQDELQFNSTSDVYGCLEKLQKQGYIMCEYGKMRNIKLLQYPSWQEQLLDVLRVCREQIQDEELRRRIDAVLAQVDGHVEP